MSRVSLEICSGGKDRRHTYSRKTEDYMADFCIVSRRTLDEFDYAVFRYHFLLGADWKLCCRRLNIDRGSFFHSVYRIEQQLGRTFRELEPYGLYPLDEYFGGKMVEPKPVEPEKLRTMPARRGTRLQIPIRKTA